MHRLEVAPAAYCDLEKLKGRIQRHFFERLKATIKALASEPRPHGARKIRGADNAYRIRTGTYRVAYEVYDKDKLVLILHIGRRTETTYRP